MVKRFFFNYKQKQIVKFCAISALRLTSEMLPSNAGYQWAVGPAFAYSTCLDDILTCSDYLILYLY